KFRLVLVAGRLQPPRSGGSVRPALPRESGPSVRVAEAAASAYPGHSDQPRRRSTGKRRHHAARVLNQHPIAGRNMKPSVQALTAAGQSIWLDYIRRDMLENGELERLVREEGLRGMTSNPSIFEKAIAGPHYDRLV